MSNGITESTSPYMNPNFAIKIKTVSEKTTNRGEDTLLNMLLYPTCPSIALRVEHMPARQKVNGLNPTRYLI